jgi:PAS domain S-box-containing protein
MADLGRDSPFPGTRLPSLGDAGQLQQFLAAIIESSDDAILSEDLDGIITSWNAGCVRLFGYTADEAIGRPTAMLHPADRHDEEAMILTRLRLGEKIDHYETVRQRKDGSLVDISLSLSPIRNQQGTIVGASKVARDITERKRTIEQQQLMLGEMRHRVKNLSTVIEALARQSRPRDEPAVEAFVDAFMGRIRALLSAGELLLATTQRNVELKQLLDKVLLPFADPKAAHRIVLKGLPIILPERTAGNLALAIHELATNALKYGALKSPQGKIQIAWSSEPAEGGRRVRIDWRESGGEPIVSAPDLAGFGSRVIRTALTGERDGASELQFERDGLHCHFEFTLPPVTRTEYGARLAY